MRIINTGWLLSLFTLAFQVQADCLSGKTIADNADVVLYGQASWVNKKDVLWKIDGQSPYRANNIYNDFGVKFSSGCQVIDNRLALDFSLYGIAYSPWHDVGAFEHDNHRARVLVDQLRLNWSVTDHMQLEGGKLRTRQGAFFLRSPASLLSSYYSGFKPTRLYDPAMKAVYAESFWGARLTEDNQRYSLSFTAVPALTSIDKRYESSGNWPADARSNASESYLLTYTDYQQTRHVPSASLMLGDTHSLALSDSYRFTQQWVLNAEVAYHREQQWRHFSPEKASGVLNNQFPSSLYETRDKDGVEIALGTQYTTDRFSVFGMEYYYQSEGYSSAQWQQQTDFIKALNKPTSHWLLDSAYDAYKYLMASEINNTANKGMLQGRHYINAYASIPVGDAATLQPYLVVNAMDGSSLLGINYATPLNAISHNLDAYAGVLSAQGRQDSEFALFGQTISLYLGFKYHL